MVVEEFEECERDMVRGERVERKNVFVVWRVMIGGEWVEVGSELRKGEWRKMEEVVFDEVVFRSGGSEVKRFEREGVEGVDEGEMRRWVRVLVRELGGMVIWGDEVSERYWEELEKGDRFFLEEDEEVIEE